MGKIDRGACRLIDRAPPLNATPLRQFSGVYRLLSDLGDFLTAHFLTIPDYIVGRGLAPAVTKGWALGNGGTKAPPYKWVWALPDAFVIQRRNLCKNRTINKNLTKEREGMFDVWMGDIELTTAVLIFSVAVLLPSQLLLCFKVKSRAIRLLPVLLLSIPTIIFVVMSVAITGWDGIGYLFLAIFTGFMMLMCGVGWGIWAISKLIKKKKAN